MIVPRKTATYGIHKSKGKIEPSRRAVASAEEAVDIIATVVLLWRAVLHWTAGQVFLRLL